MKNIQKYMKENKKAMSYIEVHTAVLLFGMTGLFGRFVELNPFVIVFGRVLFSTIFIFIWMKLKKESFALHSRNNLWMLMRMGVLLSLHWTTFFASVQYSNVAIGLLTFSVFPVFVALCRPLMKLGAIKRYEIIYGIIALLGIGIVVPLEDLFSDVVFGAFLGLVSGVLYAVFTIRNEILVTAYHGKKVAFFEHVTATVFLFPIILYIQPIFTTYDIGMLILLGTIFTGIGHSMFINGLKNVSAYMAGIITMLEPIYAIILAWILLGEEINLATAVGGVIILGSVIMVAKKERV